MYLLLSVVTDIEFNMKLEVCLSIISNFTRLKEFVLMLLVAVTVYVCLGSFFQDL